MSLVHFLAAVALVQATDQQAPADPAQTAQVAPADAVQADDQEPSTDPVKADAEVPSAETGQADDQEPSTDPVKADAEVPSADTGQADAPGTPYLEQTAAEQAPPYPAQSVARLASGDRRIQLLAYHPDQIVTLGVSPGFASVVELAEDERVENVVVGNSGAWQVTSNRRGDRVIVKPLPGASQSNMIVLTGSRRYVFVLDPYGETAFVMRFSYPQAIQTAAADAVMPTYKFRGNKMLFPLAMSDDGRRTVIRWGEQNALPAVFAMTGERNEQLVNGRMVGNDYVIEGAALRYKFRYGKAEATAVRQIPKRRR